MAVVVTVVLFVGGSLSSLSFVKIVLYNLSWNSFANNAACFSGLTSFLSLSQSQVMFTLQLPVEYKTNEVSTMSNIFLVTSILVLGWGGGKALHYKML